VRIGGVALVMVLVLAAYHFLFTGPLARAGHPGGGIARAIAYAESKEGCPYVYGAAGPCSSGYDCSSLVQAAFAAAGIGLPRTSEEQWAAGPQVNGPARGELVFFTGSPIDPPPGHVGIVLGPHRLIDAYGSGTVVRVESFGLASSAPGLQYPTGYTKPG
jgi:cell wall-associated NlpC family hydrolase